MSTSNPYQLREMEELKSILESSPTDLPVHPDPRAHNMGIKIIIWNFSTCQILFSRVQPRFFFQFVLEGLGMKLLFKGVLHHIDAESKMLAL